MQLSPQFFYRVQFFCLQLSKSKLKKKVRTRFIFGFNSLVVVLHDPILNYLIILGGLQGGMEKDTVYIVDLDTKSICYHSTLPVELKEVHAYELNGKLLVCSTFTSTSTKKLQCYTWSGANGWEVFKKIF